MSIMLGTSFYSFQEDYLIGKRNLEDCVKAATQDIGSPGVEVLFEETPLPDMLKNDRTISPSDLYYWNRLMKQYGAVPTSYGCYLPHLAYRDRALTYREHLKWVQKDIENAAMLGFPVARTGVFSQSEMRMVEALLPTAEKLGVQIAMEIHNPRGLHSWYTKDWMEIVKRTESPAMGVIIDLNIFCTGLCDPQIKQLVRMGGNLEIIEAIDAAHKQGKDLTEEEIQKMGGGEIELSALNAVKHCEYDDPEDLKDILPFCKHIHGKFLEINEEGIDRSIDYDNVIRVLCEAGWSGTISSEYEGQRWYFDEGCDIYMDPVVQVKAHQDMVKRYIAKYSKLN